MKWFYNLNISAKLMSTFILISIIAGVIGIFGVTSLNKIEKEDIELYENMTVPVGYLSEIATYFQRIRVESRDAVIYNDEEGIEESLALIQDYKSEIDKYSESLEKTILSTEYRNAFDKFLASRINYNKELNKFEKLVRENKDKEAFALINGDMKIAADAEREEIDNLVALKTKHAKEKSENNIKTAENSKILMIFIAIFAMFIAIVLGIVISKMIRNPIQKTLNMIKEMKKGHLNIRLNMDTRDEIGTMAAEMDEFADDLKNNVIGTMKKISIGNMNIDIKEKDEKDEVSPALQKTVNTIKEFVKEMNNMSKEHDLGEIDVIVDESKFEGAYKEMAKGVNDMVNGHISVKKKAMACVSELGRGNFEAEIEKFPGKKVFINESIERLRENLKNVSGEINVLISAAEEGKLNERINENQFKGDWAKIVIGLNGLISKITEPIKESTKVLKEMSNRNLTTLVNGDYYGDHAEIKNALNSTIESLNEIILDINTTADEVSFGSKQLSSSSQALSQGSTEQASSIQEVSSSMEEIEAQTTKNNENTEKANKIATNSKENALLGNSQMKNMLKAMEDINNSSNKISNIIKVIDEIAFQTNILALNAAVEAARAGQHGKGFAVVAEEVRNLAARSAEAAKETTEMIQESIKKVDIGTGIANETANALEKIVTDVSDVTSIVTSIANASNQQSNGISQINKAISQVAHVIQTNSATAEESASSSEELSALAENLKNLVSSFKITETEKRSSNITMKKKSTFVQKNEKFKKEPLLTAPTKSKNPIIDLNNDLDMGKY